jgi:hypothetical protein
MRPGPLNDRADPLNTTDDAKEAEWWTTIFAQVTTLLALVSLVHPSIVIFCGGEHLACCSVSHEARMCCSVRHETECMMRDVCRWVMTILTIVS